MSFDSNGPDLLICSMHAGSEISGRAGLLRAAQLAHQRVRPSTSRGCTWSLRESLIGCYYHAVRPPAQMLSDSDMLSGGEHPVAEIEVTVSDADQRDLIAP
jgi:hypothetical protein